MAADQFADFVNRSRDLDTIDFNGIDLCDVVDDLAGTDSGGPGRHGDGQDGRNQ